MTQKKYNVLKAATWYTIGNILVNGVAFFVLPVFTRLMSTHEYGVYSVYTSYLSIFETIVLLGLSSTISIAKFDKELNFAAYVNTVSIIPPLFSSIVAIPVMVFVLINGELLSMNTVMWSFLFVTAAIGSVNNITAARLVIEGDYSHYMFFTLISTLSNIGISLLLCFTVFRNHDVYMARVVGVLAADVLGFFYLRMAVGTRAKIIPAYIKIGMRLGIPLLFHTLATVVLIQSDRVFIRYIDSYSATGIYAIATTFMQIPMILRGSLTNAWQPWMYDKLEKKEYRSIVKLNDVYTIIFAVIITEFMLICPELIKIFTEKDYWHSIYCLIPLCIAVFGEMIYTMPTTVEYYNKKTDFIMWGTLITVCINIVLDILFIFAFGYVGAAYATAISKIILFMMHCRFKNKVDKNNVFGWKVMIGCIVGLVCFNLFVVFMVNLIYIRLFVFFVIGMVLFLLAFKYRELIKQYVRR